MHPLQSFASVDITQNPFKWIQVAIDGDLKAVSMIARMVRDLKMLPLQIFIEET